MVTAAQAYWLNRKRRQKRNAAEGVPAWVLSGAALDLNFAEAQGYNSRDVAKLTPDSILTYTAPSPKMVYGADGVLRYANHNLCLHSQALDNAAWTKGNTTVVANAALAPDGTQTADLLYPTTSGSSRQMTQTGFGLPSGVLAVVKFRLKAAGFQWACVVTPQANSEADSVYFDLLNGAVGTIGGNVVAANIVSLGNGWYECSVVGPCDGTDFALVRLASANGNIAVVPNGTDGIYVWGGEVKRYPVDLAAPYIPTTSAAAYSLPIDHDPITFDPLGVLIEEQRTNLEVYSEQFDNAAWLKDGTNITANATTAPDGTNTADTIVESAVSSSHSVGLSSPPSVVSGTVYTGSVYFKKGVGATSPDWVQLTCNAAGFGGTLYANFNLATGALGTVAGAGVSSRIQDVGNGWYRCSITAPATASAAAGLAIALTNNIDGGRAPGYLGVVTSTVYIWGAQLEAGAFPTSYIPTVTSQVTRAADQVSILTSAFAWSGGVDGTIAIELSDNTNINANAGYINMAASKNIGYRNAGLAGMFAYDGVSTAVIGTIAAYNTPFKYAFGWSNGECRYALSGVLVGIGSGATTYRFTDTTTLKFGVRFGTVSGSNTIKRLTYFPTRKSNAELQALST